MSNHSANSRKGRLASPWNRGPHVPRAKNYRRYKEYREQEQKRSPLFSADVEVPSTNKTENSR